jgi:benzoyl-CoA reductase/2-hydroxyglutaryl-CoA dehydratase subunit BcrC/BadD/HgdB
MSKEKNNMEKKKVGWFCAYVPDELIIAAGLEPARILGQVDKIKEADTYIFSNVCPYMKNILDSGLRNKLENLDGVIFTSSCDGMRRIYDLWTRYIETPFIHMLEVPRNQSEHGIQYLSAQFFDLKTRLEEVFGVHISNEKLEKAISVMNDRREMMMDLFEKQKEIPTRFKGSDLLSLCLEETIYPKDETEGKLKFLSAQSHTSNDSRQRPPRILVLGNAVHKLILFNMIEDAKAAVVVFDTCNGLKHYSDLVEKGSDPIERLARRYLLKPSCARMPGFDKRIDRLERIIEDYSIEGIIYNSLKFCDYSLFEGRQIEGFARKGRVPFLLLENDYLWGDVERMKTRIEAFLEVVREEEVP